MARTGQLRLPHAHGGDRDRDEGLECPFLSPRIVARGERLRQSRSPTPAASTSGTSTRTPTSSSTSSKADSPFRFALPPARRRLSLCTKATPSSCPRARDTSCHLPEAPSWCSNPPSWRSPVVAVPVEPSPNTSTARGRRPWRLSGQGLAAATTVRAPRAGGRRRGPRTPSRRPPRAGLVGGLSAHLRPLLPSRTAGGGASVGLSAVGDPRPVMLRMVGVAADRFLQMVMVWLLPA